MYLVVSKRFEISVSYRYFHPDWTEDKNRAVFGRQAGGEHGFGGNFTVYFVFHGPVEDHTGMIINVAVVKDRIGRLLAERYDHKFLNLDTCPFETIIPTPENLSRQLLDDAQRLFDDESAEPVVCHLEISPFTSATAYAGGRVERHYWLEFAAARRTCSPHLSDDENRRLFGIASRPSGHGHFYRLRVTLAGDVDGDHGMIVPDVECQRALQSLHDLLDHRNLSTDVAEVKGMPMTTECLARFMHQRLSSALPVDRVRLRENPYFYAEYHRDGRHVMGLEAAFHAAHRLHSTHLSDADNSAVYGKCHNLHGHGHRYRIEGAIAGNIDERSGTLFSLGQLTDGFARALAPWDYRHLDLDTDDFAGRPSTGENIVQVLWPRLEGAIGLPLHRLRLWETANNRFTLRREVK